MAAYQTLGREGEESSLEKIHQRHIRRSDTMMKHSSAVLVIIMIMKFLPFSPALVPLAHFIASTVGGIFPA